MVKSSHTFTGHSFLRSASVGLKLQVQLSQGSTVRAFASTKIDVSELENIFRSMSANSKYKTVAYTVANNKRY